MMTPEGMTQLEESLRARGYDAETASEYAARIGDTIELAQDGRWIIRADDGSILDTIAPIDEA